MGAFPLTRLLDNGSSIFLALLGGLRDRDPDAEPAGAGRLPRSMSRLISSRCSANTSATRMLALSIDLIWGYAGILSLGHGAFFALGGYAMGMYLMRQIGTRGVYANPILPDFMVFLNWQELPFYWYGFNHFAYAALMIFLVPGAAGVRVRVVRVQKPRDRRLSIDHHAGDDLCADARLLPKQFRLRRQ